MTIRVFELPPAQMFFNAIASNWRLIKQDGLVAYTHFMDRIFMQVELVDRVAKVAKGLFPHAAWIRGVWVPPHARGHGYFHKYMSMVTDWADMFGVALFSIANPHDYTTEYDHESMEDMKRTFVDGIGFEEVSDYRDKQRRQRQRFNRLGFQNIVIGNIGNPHRIRPHDCFVYLPETLDDQIATKILRNRR